VTDYLGVEHVPLAPDWTSGGSAALAAVHPIPPRTSWTAAELMACEFPEPRWAVPGVIAEGLTLLAGAPKVGKSWLALGLGIAVATGGKALGALDVTAGDVLYLALEDPPRRLQERLAKVLAGATAPGRLTLSIACEPIPAGGAQRICAWLDAHPDSRLVVVDVFAKVRGAGTANGSQYEADYAAMSALKQIADRYGVAIVVVHHTRKASSEDSSTRLAAPTDWPVPPTPSPSCVASEAPLMLSCMSPAAMWRTASTPCPGCLPSARGTCSPDRRRTTSSSRPAGPSSPTFASYSRHLSPSPQRSAREPTAARDVQPREPSRCKVCDGTRRRHDGTRRDTPRVITAGQTACS